MKINKNFGVKIFAGVFGLANLFVAIAVAWVFIAANNYFYGMWHDYGGIAEAIEKYGPQNRFRSGFSETTREQRVVIFKEIVKAVHDNGEGLEKISYQVPKATGSISLFHEAEIVHLQDVARLVNLCRNSLALIFVLWLGACLYLFYGRKRFPGLVSQLSGVVAIVVFVLVILLVYGWEEVFNQFHIWVFPQEHQWFFYYQDSLMSTLMWAPHLFTYIGIIWAFLTSIVFILLLVLQSVLNKRLKRPENLG